MFKKSFNNKFNITSQFITSILGETQKFKIPTFKLFTYKTLLTSPILNLFHVFGATRIQFS